MAFLTNTFQIEADIKQKKHIGKPVITANDTSTFIVSVQDNGVPMNMSKVTKAVLVNLCPDRQVFETVGVIQGDDKVVFDLPAEATAVAGTVRATVQLHGNEERVSTISFNYEVAKDLRMLHNPTAREKMLIEVALQDGPLYIEQAKVAAEKAEKVAAENKTRWLPAVDTVALRNSTYPNPAHGDTVRVNTEATIYRFQTGTGWIKTDQFSPTAIDQVTAQLAETAKKSEVQGLVTNKADISYVDSKVGQIVSGSPKGTYATLTSLQTAFPTGTTGVYVVTADGKWYYWTGSVWAAGGTYQSTGLSNQTVTPEKTTFANKKILSNNLFNVNTASTGYIINSSGSLYANPSYDASDFIQVDPNTPYSFSASSRVVEYNSSKAHIKQTDSVTSVVTGETTAYIRVHYPTGRANYQVNKGNVLQLYDVFVEGTTIPNLDPQSIIIRDNSITTQKIANKSVTAEKLDIINITPSPNLLDKTKIKKTGYYRYSDGVFVSSTSYLASDFIEVVVGEKYVHKTAGNVTFWDENKQFIVGLDGVASNPFTVPSGVKYAIITVYYTNIDSDMLVKGTIFPSAYIPFEQKTYTLSNDIVVNSELSGKKWSVLGDSLTEAMSATIPYHAIISKKYGMSISNHGISGTRIAVIEGQTNPMSERFANMPNDADIITVFGGTNDYGSNVPLGTINSVDKTTFMGALNVLCLGLIQKYPGKKIGFITPMQREGMDVAKMTSYVNAVKEVCGKYSIPVLDMLNGGGIYPNDPNIKTTFIPDGLHPNNEGHKIMARRIESFLKQL
ncbi:SGNH/GDSL hydrolase family protein [Planomicrobium chinense]|uniref:SGNH/GDSL hydrolase family protein n=1 Tax=Planococcus chinensis TaxID=272917 RepID=UPI001CC4F7D9|nr:SGNH/GDSL hydrolase family protein [Planococcus chinensis]MBZ5203192.1 SGNH/GDSL hydrolase family protein [Planococcus chinensis]